VLQLYHQITDGSSVSVLWATVAFCGVSAILPSNKLFFLVATLYFLSLVLISKSLSKAIFFAFLPFALLNIGQTYIVTAIPLTAVLHVPHFEGRQLYFSFSPFFVLGLTSTALVVLEIIRRKGHLNFGTAHLLLFSNLLLSMMSVFQTEQFPLFSYAVVLSQIGTVSWAVLSQLMLSDSSKSERVNVLKTFTLIVALLLSVNILVGAGQYLKRGTLNIKIEQSTVIPEFGQGADENGTQFRPIGLQTHANMFANELVISLFLLLFLLRYLQQRSSFIPWSVEYGLVAMTIGMIALTLSRTAYLALAAALVYFFFAERQRFLSTFRTVRQRLHAWIWVLILVALVVVPVIAERLLYSLNSFGVGGGITTRQALEKVAFELIEKHPFLGIGPGMFIPEGFKQSPDGIMKYFPESVHNGFLLYLTEHGALAFGTMMLFLMTLFAFIRRNFLKSIQTVVFAGLIATGCMMIFHPIQNFFSSLVMTVWIVVYTHETTRYETK
jgi:hypothetical protein